MHDEDDEGAKVRTRNTMQRTLKTETLAAEVQAALASIMKQHLDNTGVLHIQSVFIEPVAAIRLEDDTGSPLVYTPKT